MTSETIVDGVIGIVMDVTELKERELDLKVQAREKRVLLENEAAAKEASRLKSQFLANVRQKWKLIELELTDVADVSRNQDTYHWCHWYG